MMRLWTCIWCLVGIILLVGCGGTGAGQNETGNFVMPTPRPPMTLAPTYTPPPTPGPLPTITPPPARETAVPDTPIPFDETALELRYQIPLIGLDRRIQGNIGNQIIVADEADGGRAIQRNNEGSVMFELRQALSQLELAPMPEDCPGCVYLEFELTDAGLSGSGWLQDPVFLASVENFTSATLGPHFPDGAVIGLRRSASPFAPAHTLALTEDGRLWFWLANEATVDGPTAPENAGDLLADLQQVPLAELNDRYEADCRGTPLETLLLVQDSSTWTGRLRCPELALPTALQPLYVQLNAQVNALAGDVFLPKPPSAFPIDALLVYQRADNTTLTLYQDSSLIAADAFGNVYTSTLTSTQPISLTTSLLATDLLEPGYKTFTLASSSTTTTTVTAEPTASTLAVRGPEGVVDAEWLDPPGLDAIRELNQLLNRFTQAAAPTTTGTPAAAETPATPGTPDPQAETPTPTPTPASQP